ncbi:MAG: hypothetical protein RJQ01_00195 [Microcella sp.]|uniref:sensor histidine kinase n=1 Tax=Microcella sp. TaxID=1913979 RepID=UPI0033148A3B
MPLGLPSHLAARTTSTAVARAGHAVAAVSLVSVGVVGLSVDISMPEVTLWPALLALLPLLALLVMLDLTPSRFVAVCYVVIGGLCVFLATLIVSTALSEPIAFDDYTVQLLKLALMMVGGISPKARNAISWTTAGYLVGELATFGALTAAGAVWSFDATPFVTYLAVVGIHAIVGADRLTTRASQSTFFRAARDEQLADVRAVFESRATALLHDTVLNQLATVTSTVDARLSREMRASIEADLATIVGEEWFAVETPGAGPERAQRGALLRRAVAEAGPELDVTLEGDLDALETLPQETANELIRAVAQCVSNIRRHAQTSRAEIVVGAAPDELSVMVIDAGVGFEVAAVTGVRLGVGSSIVGRLDSIGGTATVWSRPGAGTSVLLRVPMGEELL